MGQGDVGGTGGGGVGEVGETGVGEWDGGRWVGEPQ